MSMERATAPPDCSGQEQLTAKSANGIIESATPELSERRSRLSLAKRLALGGLQLALGISAGTTLADDTCINTGLSAQPVRICADVSLADWRGGFEGDLLGPVADLDVPDTHRGPLRITADAEPIDTKAPAFKNLLKDPASINKVGTAISDDIKQNLKPEIARLLMKTGGLFLLGNAVVWGMKPAYDYLSERPGTRKRTTLTGVARGAAIGMAALVPVAAVMHESHDPDALETARVTGPLQNFVELAGGLEALAGQYNDYSQQLADKTNYISRVYRTAQELDITPSYNAVRVLYFAKLHCNTGIYKVLHQVAREGNVDLIIAGGDLTDYGSQLENACLAPLNDFVSDRGKPIAVLYVKGNHDSEQSVRYINKHLKNVTALQGQTVTRHGLRFTGNGDPRTSGDPGQDEAVDSPDMRAFRDNLMVGSFTGDAQVVVVHESSVAEHIAAQHTGNIGTVLSTRTYTRQDKVIGNTNLHIEGTAGANGARILEGERIPPVMFSILTLDETVGRIMAGELITIEGFGTESLSAHVNHLERRYLYERPKSVGNFGIAQ